MKLISGREAAGILKVSPATITEWVRHSRIIPVGTISGGRTFLFDREEIEVLSAALEAARKADDEAKEKSAVA